MELSFVQELVHRLKVFQAMDTEFLTVEPQMTLRQAQTRMREGHVSGLPVMNGTGMIGLVTVVDIIEALDHGHIEETVEQWMTRDVVSVDRRAPLSQAMGILDRTRYGRLPVLDENGELCGVITPESILRALLVHLNRLLVQDESSQGAEPQQQCGAMRVVYDVAAGDYDSAGLASVRLKRELGKWGIEPGILRRIAIAAHEAETNLIIHSSTGGRIVADVDPAAVRLTVSDGGPGIEDVEQAMKPGFTTASDFVRDLGFGAGMGLPNIQRCSDHFEIRSKPGYGTRLHLRFDLPTPPDGLTAVLQEESRPMTVNELITSLGLKALTPVHDQEVEGALMSDLLSNVLANGAPGYVWITIQTHRNIAAVASTQRLAAVVLAQGREPAPDLVELAEREQVTLLVAEADPYTVAGRLYELGIRAT